MLEAQWPMRQDPWSPGAHRKSSKKLWSYPRPDDVAHVESGLRKLVSWVIKEGFLEEKSEVKKGR